MIEWDHSGARFWRRWWCLSPTTCCVRVSVVERYELVLLRGKER